VLNSPQVIENTLINLWIGSRWSGSILQQDLPLR